MMDVIEQLKSLVMHPSEKATIAAAGDESERLREALGRIAKHDLQAIAINALSPNARKPIGEKE